MIEIYYLLCANIWSNNYAQTQSDKDSNQANNSILFPVIGIVIGVGAFVICSVLSCLTRTFCQITSDSEYSAQSKESLSDEGCSTLPPSYEVVCPSPPSYEEACSLGVESDWHNFYT